MKTLHVFLEDGSNSQDVKSKIEEIFPEASVTIGKDVEKEKAIFSMVTPQPPAVIRGRMELIEGVHRVDWME